MKNQKVKKGGKVSVIIPNYNGESLLKKNLPKLISCTENKNNNILEIIIVDDCSTDNSVNLLKRDFPRVKVIKHKVNRGFSASVNTGARASKGKYLALLNTDVTPSADFLANALYHFKDKTVFAVSFNEERYGPAKGFFKNGFVAHRPFFSNHKKQETFWVSGGSGIFRRNYWMQLNGMDEELFSPFYWEDVDLSYRAQKRGWKLLWESKSNVLHIHESTIGKINRNYRNKVQERNELIFIWKNITSPILFRKHLANLLKRLVNHPGYIKIVISALLKIKQIIKSRKKEVKQTKISDEAIFSKFS